MQRFYRQLGFGIALLSGMMSAQAEWITVDGFAPTVGQTVQNARQRAYENALQQALDEYATQVNATLVVSKGRVIGQSADTQPQAYIKRVKILNEYPSNGKYYMRLQADIEHAQNYSCDNRPGASYRKKVAVLNFPFASPSQAGDLNELNRAIPEELQRLLETEYGFFVVNQSQIQLNINYFQANQLHTTDVAQQVRELANKSGAQFIVTGYVINTAIEQARVDPNSNNVAAKFGDHLRRNVDFPPIIQSALSPLNNPDTRSFDIEFLVFDGLTGAILGRHRVSDVTYANEVIKTNPTALNSNRFFQTPIGQTIFRLLTIGAHRIKNSVHCLPFSTRVLQTQGKQVFIDAGAVHNMKVGDGLMSYIRKPILLPNMDGQTLMARPEEEAGRLIVRQVQPLFSIAEFASSYKNETPLQAGDIVRLEEVRPGYFPPLPPMQTKSSYDSSHSLKKGFQP